MKKHLFNLKCSCFNLQKHVGGFFAGSRLLYIISVLFVITAVEGKTQDALSGYEDISVMVQVEGYGSFYTDALYSSKGLIYISIEDLYKFLKIPCVVGQKGDSLSGFIGSEDRIYTISYQSGKIGLSKEITDVKKGLIKQMGVLFLESSLFGPTFGLHLTFNFRSLSVSVKSDFELPVLKEQRLEKMRSNIRKVAGETIADTVLDRNYHLFRFGMLDWSVTSSQIRNSTSDTRFGLGLGAELLGGEANVFINYSDRNRFNNRQQQYLWRWVDNDKHLIRQVQAGKIATQSISSVYFPVIGAVISNTPTSVRKAMGEYVINEVTQPDWFVELYINNVLMDFTRADASGLFTFKVPLVYGFTTLSLRFFGPMGEERSETRTMNVPYSFLPAGELEYRISAGLLQDGKDTPFARAETNFGLNRVITLGAGFEYLASVSSGPSIPFITASFLPLSKLMIKGEYAHGVRSKVLLNYYPWSNTMLEIDYTKYSIDQHAILYNYLEERKASISVPLKIKSTAGFVRLAFKQNVYHNFTYNMTELLLSSYYKKFNANLSTYANWVNDRSYLNSALAVSYRMNKGMTIRPSAQFNLSRTELISYKAEIEKRFLHNGYLSASYENNIMSGFNSLNFSFKYDLSFAQTSASTRFSKRDISTFQSARGSLAFGSGKKKIQVSELSTVGRGGISLIPFIDLNHNGVYDKGEQLVENLKVKINGGRITYNEKDTIIRIVGLEPFIYYNLELNDNEFDNIAWRIKNKTYKVLIDPNQFKIIEVPIVPYGEVSGVVYLRNEDQVKGIGRILVNIYNNDGVKIAETLSESDGFFNYLGLEPGIYFACIDSVQQSRLNFSVKPADATFKIAASELGDIVEGINFTLASGQSAKIRVTDMQTSNVPDDRDLNSSALNSSPENNVLKNRSSQYEIVTEERKKERLDIVFKDSINQNEQLYFVQLGAFLSNSKAEKFAVKLSDGIPYAIEIVFEDGFNKVRISNFRTKKEAVLCHEFLKRKGIVSFIGKKKNLAYWGNLDTNAGPYFVQIGAFRSEANAKLFAKRFLGAIPFPFGITIEDGFYKVRIGYFKTEAESEACYEFMKKKGGALFRAETRNSKTVF